mmetsp:Transcript_12526/g.8751  ORF Transcript_12526/g.8751 Transcript_12526/m.8751 type:complete len:105 (+) Transcript_12526:393-707(+)
MDHDKKQGAFFIDKVTKKEAPNYYDCIKNPIALRDMKNKAKRRDYKNSEMFKFDFELLRANAELFNGKNHYIAELALSVEAKAKDFFKDRHEDILNLEEAMKQE